MPRGLEGASEVDGKGVDRLMVGFCDNASHEVV